MTKRSHEAANLQENNARKEELFKKPKKKEVRNMFDDFVCSLYKDTESVETFKTHIEQWYCSTCDGAKISLSKDFLTDLFNQMEEAKAVIDLWICELEHLDHNIWSRIEESCSVRNISVDPRDSPDLGALMNVKDEIMQTYREAKWKKIFNLLVEGMVKYVDLSDCI